MISSRGVVSGPCGQVYLGVKCLLVQIQMCDCCVAGSVRVPM
jgi:hypothetical protein